eukprot:c15543_g1_i1.p1 GENE.c15543_g1_i1~~c15543_g1_i1.p1  ORF type:complete len:306 (+),score=76.53 c15543_g1_i1:392-1309(+)
MAEHHDGVVNRATSVDSSSSVFSLGFRSVDVKRRIFRSKIAIDDYQITGDISTGSYGKVVRAHATDAIPVAIKMIRRREVKLEKFQNEVECIALCQGHNNVLQLREVMSSKEHYFMVTECAVADLLDVLKDADRPFVERYACHFFHQIACAVAHMHSRGVGHRDIKPENILIMADQVVKVCDFGLAVKWAPGSPLVRGTLGTTSFIPPEMIQTDSHDPFACDVWACGVLLFLLLSCRYPFDDTSPTATHRNIVTGKFVASLPDYVSPEARDLIHALLSRDLLTRPSSSQVLLHPFFNQLQSPQSP